MSHPMLADSEHRCYWTDATPFPEPTAPPTAPVDCDLAIVGAGYTGMWAALQAKQQDPSRHVVLFEADRAGSGASTRNGGFADASLTHGIDNGLAHYPDEIDELVTRAHENWGGWRHALAVRAVDVGYEETGHLAVATEPYQVEQLESWHAVLEEHGEKADVLDRDAVRAEIDSPTFLGGLWQRTHAALVDPAKLSFGLRRVILDAGAVLHERSTVSAIESDGAGVRLEGPWGHARAEKVVLATSAFPPLVRAIKRTVVPVYDYVLVTEPLTPEQRASIGWKSRAGLADSGNQFHYSRLTADDRILWGGYDAIYHYGSRVDPSLEDRSATFDLLARQLMETFPQLEGIRVTHRWAGVIDTSTRFAVSFGTSHEGRVAYAVGYTGLGVVATRFGARVALALLDESGSELTQMSFVRDHPFPFPPEPFRWVGVTLTRRALARADRRQGRRGPWLRLLDRFGVGFDS